MLVKVYGVDAVSKKCVFEWFKRFRDGKVDVKDEPRSGRPPTSTTPDNIERVRRMLADDLRLSLRMIAEELKMSLDSVSNIIHEHLQKLLYTNRSIEDLGYFYTGPPFYHAINRPISLPPTSSPRVKFRLFTPSNPEEAYEQEITQESLSNSTFDPTLETKFLIHGFMSDLDYDDVRFETKDVLLRVGNYNVFIVDWTQHNGFPYAQAVANTRVVGALVAKMIHFLMNETGITPESIHLIGHSLGAHTSGYAGERIPGLGRITGIYLYFHNRIGWNINSVVEINNDTIIINTLNTELV
ncbi:Inactive pancreatic lipase-related protein 1 [Araneus ventricosus]|uniref:Inactive pancreatic lipase-related protein 1 n=1 Tax=Araneus ventricosus TaxID=182803 RepID=A0A4Y2VI37_ARAVE|nr:Inactive pancreatic lipase-related protein 1 [Araneus ventricosus]